MSYLVDSTEHLLPTLCRDLKLIHTTLENGLRVYLAPMLASQVVVGRLVVFGGSMLDQESSAGSAHFLEHMAFCGTPTRPDTHAITREVERLGALLNAETTKEDTTFAFLAPKNHVATACDVLSDMFLRSTIPQQSLETEREVISEELKDNEDDLGWRCANLAEGLVFGSSPLSRPIIGTHDSIQRISRQDLVHLKSSLYTGENTALIFAGAVDESFFEVARRFFKDIERGTKLEAPPAASRNPSRFAQDPVQRDRVVIKVAFPTPGHTALPESELALAGSILGQTSFSRLERALRLDSGLAYSLDCGYLVYRDAGYAEITAEVSPAKVQHTLHTLAEVIERFASDGATDEELEDAKLCGTGRAALSAQTAGDIAEYIADEVLTHGRVRPPEEHVRLLNTVEKSTLNRVIADIFSTKNCSLALSGAIPKKLKLPFGI